LIYREDLESPNDANDRAIVHAAKYFNDIILDEETKVVFITNDIANKVTCIISHFSTSYVCWYTPSYIDALCYHYFILSIMYDLWY
jgi:hypothetical protein